MSSFHANVKKALEALIDSLMKTFSSTFTFRLTVTWSNVQYQTRPCDGLWRLSFRSKSLKIPFYWNVLIMLILPNIVSTFLPHGKTTKTGWIFMRVLMLLHLWHEIRFKLWNYDEKSIWIRYEFLFSTCELNSFDTATNLIDLKIIRKNFD